LVWSGIQTFSKVDSSETVEVVHCWGDVELQVPKRLRKIARLMQCIRHSLTV